MGSKASKINFSRTDMTRWIILIFLSIIISVFLYPDMFRKSKVYNVGDVAETDIKASNLLLIPNKERTENDREEARKKVQDLYDFDHSATDLVFRIRTSMEEVRKSILLALPDPSGPEPAGEIDVKTFENIEAVADNFFKTLDLPYDEDLFKSLLELGFPENLEKSIISLVTEVFERGVVDNRATLMKQDKKGIILQHIEDETEILVKNLSRFYDLESGKKAILDQKGTLLDNGITNEVADMAVKIAASLIKPNVTFNKRETEIRRDKAAEDVDESVSYVKPGEMIVREGQKINNDHLLKLTEEAEYMQNRAVFSRVPGTAVLMAVLFSVIYITGLMRFRRLGNETRHLIFSSVTLLVVFLFIWLYSFIAEEIARGYSSFTPRAILFSLPLTFGVILITVFQGMNMAVIFSLLISILASFVLEGNIEFLIYFFVSSLAASYLVREYRARGILIKVGLQVGLLNILLALSIESIYGSLYSIEAFISIMSAFMGGFLAGVIATGFIPLVEMAFGFTTDIKLLELANLDQPLLRDLMVRAPGTYHHSVIVSNMVEATAEAINANPLLAKVSAYYHDIGKMKKPLYFIENQLGVENRHEKLAPSMSSLVLISHVKDGVELAKKHKLGPEIIDIIQQHQGKSLISFFYEKAKEQALSRGRKAEEVKEDDFRYPGPKPQTKEAGLVMLADMVEAATRSLPDPTPARIRGTVQKIINKVFSDGQLDECELTLKDLHEIAKSFNKTLGGIFHQRVEYPESNTSRNTNNGNSDQNGYEKKGVNAQEDESFNGEGLKRLGM